MSTEAMKDQVNENQNSSGVGIESPHSASATCVHESVGYFPAVNEDGWKCLDCGEQLGYRPDLDEQNITDKVFGLLNDLHESNFFYVCNGTGGDILTNEVAARCKSEGYYDQHSIVRFIYDSEGSPGGHADYWKAKRLQTVNVPARDAEITT